MIKIAICDDEKRFRDVIKSHIFDYSMQNDMDFEYHFFESCESLTQKYLNGCRYDLIFLDIDFSDSERTQMSGIEFGKKLRTLFETDNTAIVYVTSYSEYAIEAIRVRPFDYLKKPVTYKMISDILDSFLKTQKANSKIFRFTVKKTENQVVVSNIRYFESMGRHIIIHTVHNEYRFVGKLSELIRNECFENFICIHKSYFVNMNYIEKFTADSVILFGVDTVELPISQSKRKEVSERLLRG